jgi:hypothetical protein
MNRCDRFRQPLLAGIAYFLLAFASGFALGVVRTLWVEPRLGARIAELLEMPWMLVVVVMSARWTARRLTVPVATCHRLAMGLIALGLLLIAECAVVLGLRAQTIGEYLASRDPIALSAYGLMLVVFATMPLLVARHSDLRPAQRRVPCTDARDPDSKG